MIVVGAISWRSVFILLVALTSCGCVTLAEAQDAETQARINFEAAKIAYEKGDTEAALKQFKAVRRVLGDVPDLLVLIARAEMDLGMTKAAHEDIVAALKSTDPKFKKSASYQKAIELAAKIQLALDEEQVDECKSNCKKHDRECRYSNDLADELDDVKEHCANREPGYCGRIKVLRKSLNEAQEYCEEHSSRCTSKCDN